jgi:amino acid transporter
VRVNVMSGVASSIFCIVAIELLKSKSAAAAFTVVLYLAISTTLLSYLWLFPAALKLRYTHPDVERPYRVPGGNAGMWVAVGLITCWTLLGSWVAVFPGTLERVFGVDYDFVGTWGLSRGKFELYTFGTLAVIVIVAAAGYIGGARVRADVVAGEFGRPEPAAPLPDVAI